MKKFLINFMQEIGRREVLPFGLLLFLVKRCRHLSNLIPPNKKLIFSGYLNDLTVNIDTVYPIERQMLSGKYDPSSCTVFERFLTAGSVAMDVGANVGALTFLMAKLVGKDGLVLAVEPGPPTYTRLRNNLELNPSMKEIIRLFNVGLSDKEGVLYWQEDSDNRGNAGLLNNTGLPVKVTTIDDLLSQEGVKKLDFVKIDVEGMELEVIKGGIKSFSQYRPILYYETLETFKDLRGGDIFLEIEHVLGAIGYQTYCSVRKGIVKTSSLNYRPSNTLAIPNEKMQRNK